MMYDKHKLTKKFNKSGLKGLTRGERISASKLGIVPPVRSERERQLRSRYGMLLEEYSALLKLQNGACASCKKKWKQLLYVDHSHSDGHIRGLLCAGCNSIAGLIDSPQIWEVWSYLHNDYLKQQEVK